MSSADAGGNAAGLDVGRRSTPSTRKKGLRRKLVVNGSPSIVKDLGKTFGPPVQIGIIYYCPPKERCRCDLGDLVSLDVERTEVDVGVARRFSRLEEVIGGMVQIKTVE